MQSQIGCPNSEESKNMQKLRNSDRLSENEHFRETLKNIGGILRFY
jgi:hypothetical protein